MKKTKKISRNPKKDLAKKRPLHRRISLHPISILALLCMGVVLVGSTIHASGASPTISISITALPLTESATITSPNDQARFTTPDITVDGTCPNDSYVKVFKNEEFRGVALCENGVFAISLTLSEGENVLRAKVYNFSNVEGPSSGSVTVYYDAPVTPPPVATQPNTPPTTNSTNPTNPTNPDQPCSDTTALPLRIIADYTYKAYPSGVPVQLDLALTGGASPYAMAVDWNDGLITPISRSDTSLFRVEHTYDKQSRLRSYVIKVAASDLNGCRDFIQLMAVVDRDPSLDGAATTVSKGTSSRGGALQSWLKYLWPVYLTVVLMVICFYLGEREARRILPRKKHTPRLR